MTIRPPQSDQEWNEIRTLLRAYRDEFADEICFPSFEEELQSLEKTYAHEGMYMFVATNEENRETIGCVALHHFSNHTTEMRRLFVSPPCRGQHIGRKLALFVIGQAKQLGYEYVNLDTMLEMKAAQRLYMQLGFKSVSPYKHQPPDRLQCYQLSLKEYTF